ncbi:MAG: tRNA lysidine(34) synthetase TilS [Halioglobus sp.]|nr:tRNA lysidine(34) synthetase TilS [Halioglobus sp.]
MLHFAELDSQLSGLVAAPHWYVGLSGGADSTVLLHLLHSWCVANPAAPTLSAIHINHGMQAEAPDWKLYCANLCHQLAIPLISRTVTVSSGGSTEAAAREARYCAFEDLLPADTVLFLGHHLDDQVETFFLRLLRGAGVEGLAGMPRTRNLGQAKLERPLLDYDRSEIEQYAAYHDLGYVRDPSNHDTSMDRNFLREELLPLLATRWPAYRRSVIRASAHIASASALLMHTFGVPETIYSQMGDAGLSLAPLVDEPLDIAALRLRAWLREAGYQAPDGAALDEFLRQLRVTAVDGNPRMMCGSYGLQRYHDAVYRLPDLLAPPAASSVALAPSASVKVSGVGTVSLVRADSGGLRLMPEEILTLRWRQGGERCCLPDQVGSRRLKDLLQAWQVPPWWRGRVPLVYLGDDLVAVGDLARCESGRWQDVAQDGESLWLVQWKRAASAGSD